jgi:DNA gyrase subunit A
VKTINVTEKTGKLVGILDVTEKEDLMITCKSGITIRMPVSGISELGRATQGVKLIRLDEGDGIAAITQLDEEGTVEAHPDAAGPITEIPPQDNSAV